MGRNDITGDALKSKVGDPDAFSKGYDTIFGKEGKSMEDVLIYEGGFEWGYRYDRDYSKGVERILYNGTAEYAKFFLDKD